MLVQAAFHHLKMRYIGKATMINVQDFKITWRDLKSASMSGQCIWAASSLRFSLLNDFLCRTHPDTANQSISGLHFDGERLLGFGKLGRVGLAKYGVWPSSKLLGNKSNSFSSLLRHLPFVTRRTQNKRCEANRWEKKADQKKKCSAFTIHHWQRSTATSPFFMVG